VVGVVHPSVIGLHTYAHLAVHIDGPASPLAKHIASFEDAPFVSLVSGRFSLVAELRTPDLDAVTRYIDDIRSHPGVRGIDTVIYSAIVKDTNFPHHNQDSADVDDIDLQLLRELQKDGRRPYADLASMVGLSPTATRARVL
jgi:DNA-binding Lrp family transcriptional regulator